ncbi:MAG: hypothetical protein LBW85_01065 [Deltaproteobacteria bacterium]|jgi:hypothetical protein|nr:hypothetical protein [Deltaproteobacteria bacterium]
MFRFFFALGFSAALALAWSLSFPDPSLAQWGSSWDRRDERDRPGVANKSGACDRRHDRRRGCRHGGRDDDGPFPFLDLTERLDPHAGRRGKRPDRWGNPSLRPFGSDRGDLAPFDGPRRRAARPRTVYRRADLSSWPQSSLRFSFGLVNQYGKWRGGIRRSWGSGIEAIFGIVDDRLKASISVNPRLSRRDLELEAVTVVRGYIDQNVVSLILQDGEYLVLFKDPAKAGAEADEEGYVRSLVTEADAEALMSSAGQER